MIKNIYKLDLRVKLLSGLHIGGSSENFDIGGSDSNVIRNPITNIRTFGRDVNNIIEYASEYMKAANEEEVLTTLKHFPGDGVDERDQHILTSVNYLSTENWDASYGKIYQDLTEPIN